MEMRKIDVLNNLKGHVLWPQSYHLSEAEAEVCIKALKQEPICPSHGVDCEDCPAYKPQEPCDDAISRQAAIIALDDRMSSLDNVDMQIAMGFAKGIIYDLPPVTPQPKTGHWSRKTKVDAYDIAGVKTWGIKCQCDRCDFTTIVVEDFGYYKYCPNCGCRMVEPQERSE